MRLILFRHGPAGRRDTEKWPDDALRPLTDRGTERTRLAACGLALLERRAPARIITSPLVRAQQTAQILGEVLSLENAMETWEALGPDGAPGVLVRELARLDHDESAILVGHEPSLGLLAGALVCGTQTALPLKKAGACAIRFEGSPRPGGGELHWLAPPRALRRLARRAKHASS